MAKKPKKKYKVTYAGTRKSHAYGTLREARDQARWAISYGNTKACIHKRLPSGRFELVECRRRRGKR